MTDEFDPSRAAAFATGADVDDDVVETDVVDDVQDDGDDQDDSSTEEVLTFGALAATYLVPLLTAEERGPTAGTLEQRGIDHQYAVILDGGIDYALEVVDIDLGDNLGPLGKVAIGLSQTRETVQNATESEEEGNNNVSGELSQEASEIVQGGGQGV